MQDAVRPRLLALPMLTLLVAAGSEPASPRFVAGAFAMGYAAEVERACPGWRRVPAPELARRGLLDPATRTKAWSYDSPLHDSFWSGMEAAQRDRATHAGFCVDPARLRRTSRVAQAIEPNR